MSIKRDRSDIVIECDRCEAEFTINSDDFKLTWDAAKEDGWRARKVGKDWVHGCPLCGVD